MDETQGKEQELMVTQILSLVKAEWTKCEHWVSRVSSLLRVCIQMIFAFPLPALDSIPLPCGQWYYPSYLSSADGDIENLSV